MIHLSDKEKSLIHQKLQSLSQAIQQIESEEKEIISQQQQLDEQQNEIYDYYETEFVKLKLNYDKITEDLAIATQNKEEKSQFYAQILESKAMLKEDLNGKLLQRAELVAQKEEQDEMIEQCSSLEPELFSRVRRHVELHKLLNDLDKKYLKIEKDLRKQLPQVEFCKNETFKHNHYKLIEKQLQSSKCKTLKTKLVSIQKSMNLTHPDTLINEFLNKSDCNQASISQFIQTLRNQLLKQGGTKWTSSNEYFTILHQYLQIVLQNNQIQNELNDIKSTFQTEYQQCADLIQIHEYSMTILKKEQNDINERKQQIQRDIQYEEDILQKSIQDLSEQAFLQYIEENKTQLEQIQNEYGESAYQQFLNENKEQFNQIISKQQIQKFNNILGLLKNDKRVESVIQQNMTVVDEQILPDLKNLLPQLENLKRQVLSCETIIQYKSKNLEDADKCIQNFEKDFRVKIEELNIEDDKLSARLQFILYEKQQKQKEFEMQKQKLVYKGGQR